MISVIHIWISLLIIGYPNIRERHGTAMYYLFITKNVMKHEKQQSPWNKWLSQGTLSFLLFLYILLYSKVSGNRKTTKSLEFLHFLQFLHNSTKPSAASARQGMRSVPVISVPSRSEAWEVYPLEVYYPDDPTRLCRPKAGQSLVWEKFPNNPVFFLLRAPLTALRC